MFGGWIGINENVIKQLMALNDRLLSYSKKNDVLHSVFTREVRKSACFHSFVTMSPNSMHILQDVYYYRLTFSYKGLDKMVWFYFLFFGWEFFSKSKSKPAFGN